MKRKKKIIYVEDIYPSHLGVDIVDVAVSTLWKPYNGNMRCLMFWWENKQDGIVAMSHQSLQ